MTAIRSALNTYLKALYPRVYFQVAPENAAYPYLIFDVSLYPDGEGAANISLDIDGWDCNDTGDTTTIENLMKLLKPLDKATLSTDEITATIYIDSKIPILDDDKRIKRRKYTYEGKLYNKE